MKCKQRWIDRRERSKPKVVIFHFFIHWLTGLDYSVGTVQRWGRAKKHLEKVPTRSGNEFSRMRNRKQANLINYSCARQCGLSLIIRLSLNAISYIQLSPQSTVLLCEEMQTLGRCLSCVMVVVICLVSVSGELEQIAAKYCGGVQLPWYMLCTTCVV